MRERGIKERLDLKFNARQKKRGEVRGKAEVLLIRHVCEGEKVKGEDVNGTLRTR